MKHIDQVKIAVDDRYAVAVSKDHIRGVVVQVARLNPTHVSTDKGVVSKGHQPVVVWQTEVSYGTINRQTNEVVFKDHVKVQQEVAAAISKAQSVAAQASAMEKFIDSLMVKLDSDLKNE